MMIYSLLILFLKTAPVIFIGTPKGHGVIGTIFSSIIFLDIKTAIDEFASLGSDILKMNPENLLKSS